MNSQTNSHEKFVQLTMLPRPDHPAERRPVVVRADSILFATETTLNYTPEKGAPIAVLPNSPALKNIKATIVTLGNGTGLTVMEPVADVLRLIAEAYNPTLTLKAVS